MRKGGRRARKNLILRMQRSSTERASEKKHSKEFDVTNLNISAVDGTAKSA
jgi:hypothetical protein